MTWDRASRRHAELPPDWPIIRRDILERDNHTCQIRLPGCTTTATDVDHIGSRHQHERHNLRAACRQCHAKRTATQGHDAMRQRRTKTQHRRETHPGIG